MKTNSLGRTFVMAGLLTLAVAGAAVMLGSMGGCDSIEPTTPSPFTGQLVNAAQLSAQVAKAERDERAKAIAADNADKAEARAAALKAQQAALETAARLDITAAEVKRDLGKAQVDASAAMAAIAERSAERAAALKETLAGIQAQVDSAFADIEGKQAQRTALASVVLNNPIVKGFAGTAGVDTSALLGLMGAGSTALVLARRKAVADKAYEEGQLEAHKARDAQDAAYEEARAHTMALLMPPPK